MEEIFDNILDGIEQTIKQEDYVEDEIDKTEDSFVFKINDFTAPLDLLLELIQSAKVNVRDIFLTNITEQYIEMVKTIGTMDLERGSEFVMLAARLLEIKTRKLLQIDSDEEYIDTDEEELYSELEEKLQVLFKETASYIAPLQQKNMIERESTFSEKDVKVVISDFSLDKLINAYVKVLHKIDFSKNTEQPKLIVKDTYTIANRMEYIQKVLTDIDKTSFFALFENVGSKFEVINTFLAILELLKEQVIGCKQEEEQGDIELYKKGDFIQIDESREEAYA